MSSTARDHAGQFLDYLDWYEKAKSANDSSEVARFALQAVNEIHLMMPGRNDRAGAVRITHRILGPLFTKEKVGELYDQLREDAKLMPAI